MKKIRESLKMVMNGLSYQYASDALTRKDKMALLDDQIEVIKKDNIVNLKAKIENVNVQQVSDMPEKSAA